MTEPYDMRCTNPLPKVTRLITAHDSSNGQAVFSKYLPEEANFFHLREDTKLPVGFFLGYITSSFPAPLTHDRDLDDYRATFEHAKASGLVKRGGTLMRYVDYPPDCKSPMHRTVSLDYGIVIEGELECVLDSGERRIMKRGDVAVQSGTMHQWTNHSKTEWARMVYVLIDVSPVLVNGEALGEDLVDMKGVLSHIKRNFGPLEGAYNT